ncbi:hypothetical protein WT25_11120 [Burkholderia territorii]|uniref:hypothetical protein n=1 Tax=Burkholderia territorii TaxID=1503055 RepID=UPI000754A5F6|nr:hypothetical protein [Burkholderia territorii]KVT86297.1 hypothetical protein WT25_11120 [Burkholderia territorii]MDN8081195.1 hypothetical protein [Burkholderia multivorans]
MDLHTYLLGLPRDEREPFGKRCGSTYGRLMQIAYGNEPASAELCAAIDRESGGVINYRRVNDAWEAKRGATDTRKRIPMDWDYIERKARAEGEQVS